MTTTNQTRPISPYQKTTYLEVCAKKGIQPEQDFEAWSYDQAYKTLGELFKAESPSQQESFETHPNQKAGIERRLSILKELGVEVSVDYANLRYKEASEVIQKLQGMIDASPKGIHASPAQINLMADMFVCPDVDYGDVGISTRITLDEGGWRKPTREELESLLASVKKEDASLFIDKYKVIFFDFKKSRISDKKQAFIKSLQERVANKRYSSTTIEETVDQDGVISLSFKPVKTWNPTTFVPMSDEWIALLDNATADEYILQLQSDLKRDFSVGEKADNSLTFEELRPTSSTSDEEIVSFLHRLNAMLGYDTDLIASHDAGEKDFCIKLKETMNVALEEKVVSVETLLEMIGGNEVLLSAIFVA